RGDVDVHPSLPHPETARFRHAKGTALTRAAKRPPNGALTVRQKRASSTVSLHIGRSFVDEPRMRTPRLINSTPAKRWCRTAPGVTIAVRAGRQRLDKNESRGSAGHILRSGGRRSWNYSEIHGSRPPGKRGTHVPAQSSR